MEEIKEMKVKVTKGKRGRPRVYEYLEPYVIPIVQLDKDDIKVEEPVVNKIKYSTQYYQDHKDIKVTCPKCLQEVQKYTIGKHQKNKTCILIHSIYNKTMTNNI